jgi:iron complex outermembrane receptor protein
LPPYAGARGRNIEDATFTDVALNLEGDLTSTTRVRWTNGYRNFNRFIVQDLDGTPAAIADQVDLNDGHSLTSEAQLSSLLWDDRLEVLGGAFVYREVMHEDQANDFFLGLAQDTPSLQAIDRRARRSYENESLAGYSHLSLKVSPRLRLIAGIRYSRDKKHDREADSALATNDVTLSSKAADSWNSITPQLSAEYTLSDKIFGYATISRGYASGGFSNALAGIGIQQYNPESLWNYEAGIKTELLDRTLQVNSSVFFMNYTNIVAQSYETAANGTPVNVYSNAGKAHVRGIDTSLEWRPLPAVSIDAGLGLLAQEILQYGIGANGAQIPPGTAHFFNSPSASAHAAAQYAAPLNAKFGTLLVEGSWTFFSRTYFDNTNSITSSQSPFSLYNGNLTYRWPGERLAVTLFAANIADKAYLTRTTNGLSSLGVALAQFGPPRTFGVRLRYTF